MESLANVYRPDGVGELQDNYISKDIEINQHVKTIQKLNLVCESTMTVTEQCQEPREKQREENMSCYSSIQPQTYIDFFSLPKFGMIEKACQTMLTGREIEDLEHLTKEFLLFKSEFTTSISKGKPEDALKRLFPSLEDFKLFPKLKDKEVLDGKKEPQNFICVKRRSGESLPFSNERYPNIKTFKTSTQNGVTHLHFKKTHSGRRRRKNDLNSNTSENLTIKSQKNISKFSPEISPCPKKDFEYEDDIAGIINHIKNSSSKQEKKVNFIENRQKATKRIVSRESLPKNLKGNLMLINISKKNIYAPTLKRAQKI